MTPKELANATNVKLWKVYYVAERLGRLPTENELVNWKQKRGRPTKNWQQPETKKAFDNMFEESNDALNKLCGGK